MITEGYERCRQRKLPSIPSHKRKLSITLMILITTYAEIYELRVWMVGGIWVRKSRYGDGITLDVSCFFSSLLLFLLDFGPVQMASARVFTTYGVSQVEVDFPRALHPPNGRPEAYRSVAGLMISYKYVRGMIV